MTYLLTFLANHFSLSAKSQSKNGGGDAVDRLRHHYATNPVQLVRRLTRLTAQFSLETSCNELHNRR